VASGRIGADGLFRDPAGGVIGRGLGSTVLVDPDTLPAPIGRTGAAAQTAAHTAQGRPQLCPDPIPENTAGRSERAIAYQQQIAGRPPGLEVRLNAVGFDGCRETGGTMIEVKGPGYADKMTGDTTWQGWFTGDEEIEAQMQRQARAAAAPIVEGHFAEQSVADYFRNYAERNGLTNIIVIYTPADQP